MNNKPFLYIIIATITTILIWVVLDIMHSQSKVQIPPEVKQLLEPINPAFDQEAINEL